VVRAESSAPDRRRTQGHVDPESAGGRGPDAFRGKRAGTAACQQASFPGQ